MLDDQPESHLSRISTIWALVREAHGDAADVVSAAQSQMIDQYSGAVYRYLLAVLKSQDAADEVFQEFAFRLIQGGFRKADRARGRFRDYLKVAVIRLIHDYRRHQKSERGGQVELNLASLAEDRQCPSELEASFVVSCRQELLSQAWRELRRREEQSGQLLFTVLDYRAHNPKATSQQMADDLSGRLERTRPLTAAGVRKTLERARIEFADELLAAIGRTLETPDPAQIEQELIDLGLHAYCGHAWRRRFGDANLDNQEPPDDRASR